MDIPVVKLLLIFTQVTLRRFYVACAMVSASFFISHLAMSADYSIAFIQSERNETYQEFTQLLNDRLRSYNVRTSSIFIDSSEIKDLGRYNLLIPLGTRATQYITRIKPSNPVLAGFISRSFYEKHRTTSAVFIDQPAENNLALIKAALPGKNYIGIAVSSESNSLIPDIIHAGEKLGFHFHIETVASQEYISHVINRLVQNNDVVLALPDGRIYNKYTLQNILLTSYRSGIPVIGYSDYFVTAGSLMSTYSSSEDMASQFLDTIVKTIKTGKLPPATSSRYFSIAINRQVANSMSLDIKDTKAIRLIMDGAHGND